MNNFTILSPSQAPHFRFIIKKSLYKRFYTKPSFPTHFHEFSTHHTVFLSRQKFRLTIRLYSLWIYNGGIDAQNAHFQTDKSQNELHYLKFSSIYSFWTKIKRPSVLQPTVKRIYGTKKVHFFSLEMIFSFFSLNNANDNIILRRET